MSHFVGYVVCGNTEKEKDSAVFDILEEAEHEADYDPDIRFEWKNMTPFDNYDAAEAWIKSHDRSYWCVAVPYMQAKDTKFTKKAQDLEDRARELYREWDHLARKIHYKDVKAAFISCRHCGSKLATSHVERYENQCPVCGHDLRPQSTLDRIKAKRKQYDEAIEKERQERARCIKNNKKKEINWLLKYEYHC